MILGMGATKKPNPLGMLTPVLALLLCLCVSSWGACWTANYSVGAGIPSGYCCNDGCGSCNGAGHVGWPFCSEYSSNCPSVYTIPTNGRKVTNLVGVSSNASGCNIGDGISCHYNTICDTQAEADSVACSRNPNLPNCTPPCDSTKWECQTSTETTQTTIANDNVTCFNGECYGGIYCEYVTRNETTCTNECGTSQTEIAEFPMRYEGRCNEETAPDEDMCTSQKCMTNNGFYHLYRLCKNRNIVNGESQTIPVFEGGGVGTCANAGYKEENPNVNGGSSSSTDSTGVPVECYTMGINCPVPSDSTDYTDSNNRNQDNGCTCEPYDGVDAISLIICPDGSSSIFYGSCNDWKQPPSSDSQPPESSGSGSENPPTSSGVGDTPTDWVKYSQGEEIKALLGQIVLNTAKENQITINNQSNLGDYAYSDNGQDYELIRTDSLLVLEPDMNGIMALRDSLFNRIFDKVDINNTLIDTLINPNYSGCPAVRLMGGGQPVHTQSGVYIEGFTIDFCDAHGFNLVRIIGVIVTSFASVVGFFVGFKIFKSAMG